MPRKKKQPSYEEQRDKWYAKLKREGFEDIEVIGDPHERLKLWSSTLIANRTKVFTQHGGWEAKAEYYRLAAHFLNDYKFKKRVEAVIWDYHANGISIRDIAKTLNKVRSKKLNYWDIWAILKRLRAEMYKMYLPNRKQSE